MNRHRYLIRFTKSGLLRWISHRDLARLWERMVRRTGVRLAMSEGFSPKAKISFPTALALGVESLDEVVELELVEPHSPERLLAQLADDRVGGLSVLQVCRLPDDFGKAQFTAAHYVLLVPPEADWPPELLASRIDSLLNRPTLTFVRKHKEVQADVREQVLRLEMVPLGLLITLAASRTASLRPGDVLAALEIDAALEAGARLVRLRTELDRPVDTSACAQVDDFIPRDQTNRLLAAAHELISNQL